MRLLSVQQNLVSNPLADVTAEVHRQLDSLGLEVPQGEVAITAGSRGICHIGQITRAVGDWLRERGASPFIIPSMGSHNGATAVGQRQMIEALGITEQAMDMPIRASMECVKVGSVATGDVWMDRHAYEADGVLVLNRIKLHTCFSGPVQSGLVKMMVIGMGKIRSAETFHAAPNSQMKEMLLKMGRLLLDSGKICGGLAILEDGFDQTAELHAVRAQDILATEPKLIQRHRHYFPQLPIDELNVLVVDSIGKTYSGTGMDTNVLGYRGIRSYEDLEKPTIQIIAALSLAAASQGNAIGVGLADFITQNLRAAIDEQKTFINVYTTGEMERAKIPATLADDQQLIEKIAQRYGQRRWMFIANTLHLGQLYASEDLRDEIEAHPLCTIDPQPVELKYVNGKHQLVF
ncbi:MAG: DUF362 domain-containing protein [Pirellulales bacterium]